MSYCNILDQYYCASCVDPEQGRIRGVAYVVDGAPLANTASDLAWLNLVCNNLAVIIPEVRGTYDGGAPIESAGYGKVPQKNTGYNHQISYFEKYNCDNIAFYNKLKYNSNFIFYWVTDKSLYSTGVPVQVSFKNQITDDTNSQLEFEVTIKWSNPLHSECLDIPSQVFKNCDTLNGYLACHTCTPITTIYDCNTLT